MTLTCSKAITVVIAGMPPQCIFRILTNLYGVGSDTVGIPCAIGAFHVPRNPIVLGNLLVQLREAGKAAISGIYSTSISPSNLH